MSASALNPTRYWVHYTNDERQLIAGYYNDDIYEVADIPAPSLEITYGEWQNALDSGANKVDHLNNLVVDDDQISIYNTITGEIKYNIKFNDEYELAPDEAMYYGGSDTTTQYIVDGVLTERPESIIAIDENFIDAGGVTILNGVKNGLTMKLLAKSENTINVYLDEDAYNSEEVFNETILTEDTVEVTWPYKGTIEIQITGDFPTKDYTTTLEVR